MFHIPRGGKCPPPLPTSADAHDFNDLSKLSYMLYHKYVVSSRGKSIIEVEDKLNTDLENIRKRLMADKLPLNKDKTEYMVIGSREKLT